MGAKTKIDWCDASWNPVTGCLHGCEYCYARGIANRFGLPYAPKLGDPGMEGAKKYDSAEGMDTMLELVKPFEKNGRKQPYPMGFLPTFHRYKLEEPQHWRKPRSIFVCSMADLFGEWVPEEWIKAVFDACAKAPQHRYLFLTKNPKRYIETYPWYLERIQRISKAFEAWFGYTYDGVGNGEIRKALKRQYSLHQFISIEPMRGAIWEDEILSIRSTCDWVIIGAETGNRRDKVVPEKRWIMKIADQCEVSGIPVFMKESLRGIMGEDFRQEFPWE